VSEGGLWRNLVGFSGEQTRWAKAKAALTRLALDRAIGGDFDCSTRFWWVLWSGLLARTRATAQFSR